MAFFVATLFLILGNGVFAQVGSTEVDARRAALENELANLERLIEQQRTLLQGKQKESVSLERDLAFLEAQIRKSKLEIRARDLEIKNIGSEIIGKNEFIGELDEKLFRQKKALAELLRKTRELDSVSLVQVAFSGGTFTEFFKDLENMLGRIIGNNQIKIAINRTI